MILVTGGTGLVGAHVLYHLALKEVKIRALYRTQAKIAKTKHVFSYYTDNVDTLFDNIEWVKGDILNIPELSNAFKGITKVYHCAAKVSFDPNDYQSLRKTNIEGTANIVNLCLSNNIEKLCYVSSTATLGPSESNTINESNHWNPEAENSVYAITKHGAEMEVWRATQEGLDAVIVNPGIILGGGFWQEGSGALFGLVKNGLKFYTKGVAGFVDVNDVAKAMLQLLESPITNQRYLLVAENWSFERFFNETAQHLNAQAPKKEARRWQLQVVWRLDWLKNFLTKSPRKLTKQTAESLLSVREFNSDKIRSDLSFTFKPIEDSIAEVSQYFLNDQ